MTEKDVLARIGETLIQIQRTEVTINFCIRHVVPLKAKPAKDVFQPAGRRAPLGALIAELRRQIDVPLTFKATLQEYARCFCNDAASEWPWRSLGETPSQSITN